MIFIELTVKWSHLCDIFMQIFDKVQRIMGLSDYFLFDLIKLSYYLFLLFLNGFLTFLNRSIFSFLELFVFKHLLFHRWCNLFGSCEPRKDQIIYYFFIFIFDLGKMFNKMWLDLFVFIIFYFDHVFITDELFTIFILYNLFE